MKAVMCLRPICRREENITNRARTGPNEESKSASNIGGSYSKKRIASKQGTSLTSPAYIRPRENAHGVPIRHWRIGASRESFRPCKLLPKQLATGELLTSGEICEKFRLGVRSWRNGHRGCSKTCSHSVRQLVAPGPRARAFGRHRTMCDGFPLTAQG